MSPSRNRSMPCGAGGVSHHFSKQKQLVVEGLVVAGGSSVCM
jgi:hypothetical protein